MLSKAYQKPIKSKGVVMIKLRPTSPDDCALLRYWDTQPHVLAADPNDDWLWETELYHHPPWREMWIAECDNKPIGFIQIIDPKEEDSHYWGAVPAGLRAIDLWIGEAAMLGQGYGTLMMQQALARCFAVPEVDAVLIDPLASNTAAQRFYKRQGFIFIEERWFGLDHCYVYRLSRQRYQQHQH